MLARRATAEVAVDDEDRCAAVSGIVEWVGRAGLVTGGRPFALVFEEIPLQPFERHCAQIARRHDTVGVDVVAAQRKRGAFYPYDSLGFHVTSPSSLRRLLHQ